MALAYPYPSSAGFEKWLPASGLAPRTFEIERASQISLSYKSVVKPCLKAWFCYFENFKNFQNDISLWNPNMQMA